MCCTHPPPPQEGGERAGGVCQLPSVSLCGTGDASAACPSQVPPVPGLWGVGAALGAADGMLHVELRFSQPSKNTEGSCYSPEPVLCPVQALRVPFTHSLGQSRANPVLHPPGVPHSPCTGILWKHLVVGFGTSMVWGPLQLEPLCQSPEHGPAHGWG